MNIEKAGNMHHRMAEDLHLEATKEQPAQAGLQPTASCDRVAATWLDIVRFGGSMTAGVCYKTANEYLARQGTFRIASAWRGRDLEAQTV